MSYSFEDMSSHHRTGVIDVFNYYIAHSFAAYPEQPVGDEFFDRFLEMARGYPSVVVKDDSGRVVGFAFLHAHHAGSAFRRTAEVTYFIMPEHTGRGLGTTILERFVREARGRGIDTILANIVKSWKSSTPPRAGWLMWGWRKSLLSYRSPLFPGLGRITAGGKSPLNPGETGSWEVRTENGNQVLHGVAFATADPVTAWDDYRVVEARVRVANAEAYRQQRSYARDNLVLKCACQSVWRRFIAAARGWRFSGSSVCVPGDLRDARKCDKT